MNKLHIIVFSLVVCLIVVLLSKDRLFPKQTIQVQRKTSFILQRDFQDVRKSFVQGKFQEEILKINNASLISSSWKDKKFLIQKPLQADRYWCFDGTMLATVKISSKHEQPMIVDMVHEVHVASDEIKIHVMFHKPINGIDLQQDLIIVPAGPGLTKVSVVVNLQLCRFIPSWWMESATKQVTESAETSVANFEQVIKAMPVIKGFVIPIRK